LGGRLIETPQDPVQRPSSPTQIEANPEDIRMEPVEKPKDFFDTSGPFSYIFERSAHLEPIPPTPTEKFWKILEIIDTTRPHFLVLENVKSLVRNDSGATYEELKRKLVERGYFHRYRILDTLEKNVRIYVSCLKETEVIDTSYMSEKVEEARISIIMNPSVNKKYVFDREVSEWLPHETRKNATVYQYIRLHILRHYGVKPQPRIESSHDGSLRQCFDLTQF
jgi:hypothetical protein